MNYLIRTLQLGYKSLWLHKLRSGLAMLGILIGVTAVIWLVALGEGVSYQAQQQIKDLGATNIIIKSSKPAQGSTGDSGLVIAYGLTRADYERIIESVPTITRAVPMREISTTSRAQGRSAEVQLLGITEDYFSINHLKVSRGRLLAPHDLERRENVCVIGDATAEALFKHEDPIGKTIELAYNNTSDLFVVVGITQSRTPTAAIGGSLAGRDYNFDVYIPLSTFRARIGDQVITSRSGGFEGELVELNQITVTVDDVEHVEDAADIVTILLEKYHKYQDYSIVVPKELLRQAEMLRLMFNVLLVLIAGISLVVGGIGIMNIMLATVTERTREIGIRRAIGATQPDIVWQFLGETVVLSGTGGLLGVAAGFLCYPVVGGIQFAVQQSVPDLWETIPPTIRDLEPMVAPWSIIAAFGISVGVGVLFGLYPARRAAMMDPIEALRHE
ncbi:Macrolide export ATP-binding/permease protein MacB [Maioricimonas rarisocia]|uniref:Macrolide export ATP-binding/permease protein MacB n=1 Tax=Maioricimonas rarisocia TaxID=2528026 RepID=A0A517ZC16_9PLAN|nr:ABC transporter permease [Maioricimonas rarisocia]QDU40002.1 Macrolide export ATP-binding/permease protein MacB [Maioricimonas rarisocia]